MLPKNLAIFPIKASSIEKKDVFYAKTLTLFLNLSLEYNFSVSSYIVRLTTSDNVTVPEYIYMDYPKEELIEKFSDTESDFIIYGEIKRKNKNNLVSLYIYKNNRFKELIIKKNYIFSEMNFEDIYKRMIKDIFIETDSIIIPEMDFISRKEIFEDLLKIIENDNNFFYVKDEIKYIENLRKLYLKYREVILLRYIIRKILLVKNYFLLHDLLQTLKQDIKNNDYIKFLLANALFEFNQYDEILNLLNSIEKNSLFYKLKESGINKLKARVYLKRNDLKSARNYIMKAINNFNTDKETNELFLEIMFKSKYFGAFKAFIKKNSFTDTKENSVKINYWLAKYYYEVLLNPNIALLYINDYRFNELIIFQYLKTLYYVSYKSGDYSLLELYIKDLLDYKILSYENNNQNNFENTKLFIKVRILLKQKNNLAYMIKNKIDIQPFNETALNFKETSKIIFNYIYEHIDKDSKTINALLFFILEDYKKAVNFLAENDKALYYYATALITPEKRLKYLKKSFKIKEDILVLNRIIQIYAENRSYFKLKKYLKIRRKYIKDDEFDIYYQVILNILKKNYSEAINILEKSSYKGEIFKKLKAEILFYQKDYDSLLVFIKKNNDLIMSDYRLSYICGIVMLKIKNDRKGLFYLQNSYKLNPDKILKKVLIKEYKRYGINYFGD